MRGMESPGDTSGQDGEWLSTTPEGLNRLRTADRDADLGVQTEWGNEYRAGQGRAGQYGEQQAGAGPTMEVLFPQ